MWFSKYNELTIQDKKSFSLYVNKLLQVNYLVKVKKDSTSAYFFISKHFEIFKEYLLLMDIELEINNKLGVISISNIHGTNKINLKLLDSIFLLILRLLYEENKKEITLNKNVEVKISDIHDMFNVIGFEGLNKTKISECLILFKKYSLININSTTQFKVTDLVTIYPAIEIAINVDEIKDVYSKLDSYKSEDNNEETKENQAD